jgi:hypothetical protein
MRAGVLFSWVGLFALAATQTPPPGEPGAARAALVLTDARKALGGEKLSSVTAFTATGRTQQVQGDNLVPIEFEISCALPDKCVRRDEVPAKENGPTFTGFNGDALVLLPAPPMPLPEPARQARLTATRQDFSRLLLGFFANSATTDALSFSYAGEAQAPQGTADVLDAAGPAGFAARLFISHESHLPIMVSWTAAGARGAPPVENRLYYADYRDANGLRWPYRVRRAVGTNTVEETTFDRFRLNPRLDAKIFGAR